MMVLLIHARMRAVYVASHHSNSCKTFVGGSAHRPLKRIFNSPKLKFSSAANLKQRCDNGHHAWTEPGIFFRANPDKTPQASELYKVSWNIHTFRDH